MCIDPATMSAMGSMVMKALPSIAMSAVGGMMQQRAVGDERRRVDNAVMGQIENQRRHQSQAIGAATEGARRFAPEEREQAIETREGEINQGLGQALERSQALTLPESPVSGNVSDAYLTRRAGNFAEEQRRAVELARMMSKTMAPGSVQGDDRMGLADTASRVGLQQSFAGGQHAADQVAIQGAQGVNPWLYLGGSAMQGAGYLFPDLSAKGTKAAQGLVAGGPQNFSMSNPAVRSAFRG